MLLTGVYLSCPNPATPWRRCRHKSLTEPLKPSDGCCQNWASWTDTSTALLRGEIELNLVETSTIFGCRWQNEANFSRSDQWLENRANFWLTQSPRIRARVGGSSTLPGVAYVEPLALGNLIRDEAYEAAVQRSKRKTGNHEPHSDRCRERKGRADRRTRTPSGPIGTRIGACAQSNRTSEGA